MSFSVVKTWDDRRRVKEGRLQKECINGRTWIRRIQWLEDGPAIKLKFESGDTYHEVGVLTEIAAQTAWDRFKAGQEYSELLSIFGVGDIKVTPSRKASL